MVAPFADQLALVEDRPRNAVQCAREGGVLEPLDRMGERRLPRRAEAFRLWPGAQLIGRGAMHADALAGLIDAAAGGERLDEGDLLLGRPAVVAGAERDGLEGGELFGLGSHCDSFRF